MNRFMKEVEAVTTAVPKVDQSPDTAEFADDAGREEKDADTDDTAMMPAVHKPQPASLAGLFAAGSTLLASLSRSMAERGGGNGGPNYTSFIEKDTKTGKCCLKLPLPDQETAATISSALTQVITLLNGIAEKRA